MMEPKDRDRGAGAVIAQPGIQTAALYGLMSALALCGAGASAWFIVSRIETLARYMAIEKAYYILLVLVGLGAAAFLFGAMRSYGVIRGKRFGAAFEFGGPAAAAVFITLAGMGLTRPAIPFDLTIRFVGMDEINADDRVEVDLGSRHETPQIGPIGDVIVRDVTANSKADPVYIRLISDTWRIKGPLPEYTISASSLIRITAERKPQQGPQSHTTNAQRLQQIADSSAATAVAITKLSGTILLSYDSKAREDPEREKIREVIVKIVSYISDKNVFVRRLKDYAISPTDDTWMVLRDRANKISAESHELQKMLTQVDSGLTFDTASYEDLLTALKEKDWIFGSLGNRPSAETVLGVAKSLENELPALRDVNRKLSDHVLQTSPR